MPVFKKKISLYLYSNLVSFCVLRIPFPNLNESNTSQIFMRWYRHSDPQINLETNHTCSSTSRFARTVLNMQQYFHNHWSMHIFLLLGEALIFWWMHLKIALYSLFRQPGFCLIFILSKNKGFQSGTLLKCQLHLLPWKNFV